MKTKKTKRVRSEVFTMTWNWLQVDEGFGKNAKYVSYGNDKNAKFYAGNLI